MRRIVADDGEFPLRNKPLTKVEAGQLQRAMTVLQLDRPDRLPARVVYTLNGGVMPETPPNPDNMASVPLDVLTDRAYGKTRPRDLTPRADAMARFIAHGVTASDAYRLVYKRLDSPHRTSQRANAIAKTPRFRNALTWYRGELERTGKQNTFDIRDYVMSRLVIESQEPDSAASARIRATELLGKTQSMFVDVRRTEKVIDPAQLAAMKGQLEQRLKAVLSRLGMAPSLQHGTEHDGPRGIEAALAGPHDGGTPLEARRDPVPRADTNPPTQGPNLSPPPTQAPVLTPHGGTPPNSTQPGPGPDLDPPEGATSEFDGPLVLHGGLSGK